MTAKFDPDLLPEAPDLSLEKGLWKFDVGRVCGIDEAGRGALAGPVFAAALILPADPHVGARLQGLRDSKALSWRQRRAWNGRIQQLALDYATGSASPEEIDQLGILPATRLAAQRALYGLRKLPDHLVLDYLFLPDNPLPQTSLIKGDARCLTVAAASVLAKVARDQVMLELSAEYPLYGFASHKGYGTEQHRFAIRTHGPSRVHRLTFAPLSSRHKSSRRD